MYQKPDPMLVINNSFVEPAEGDVPVVESAKPQPSTSAEGNVPVVESAKPQPSTSAEGDVPVVESAEPQPSTSAEGQIPRNNSNKANEAKVKVKKFGEELLQLTLGGKKYKPIEVADDGPELQKKDVVEDILKVPQAKVSRMGRAQMQGLPRCISDKKY